MKVFDQNGNELCITDVVHSYILQKASEHKIEPEELLVGIYKFQHTFIECYITEDNGRDGLYLSSLSGMEKVSNT